MNNSPVAAELRNTIDAHLGKRDRASAVAAAVDAVRSGSLSIETLYTQVLSPLLMDTGAAWQQGTTAVWEEHFASATVRTIIESLYADVSERAAALPRLDKTAVLACPAGETHDLGLRMLVDRMQLHGWDAYFIGADTPVADIIAAAISLKADLVAISAATHYNRMLLRDVVDELQDRLPGIRIGVGGPAFTQDKTWPAEELLTEAELGLGSHVELTGE
jgi:MerR family transcriptional regulator, light-induced transcriptional regulator